MTKDECLRLAATKMTEVMKLNVTVEDRCFVVKELNIKTRSEHNTPDEVSSDYFLILAASRLKDVRHVLQSVIDRIDTDLYGKTNDGRPRSLDQVDRVAMHMMDK